MSKITQIKIICCGLLLIIFIFSCKEKQVSDNRSPAAVVNHDLWEIKNGKFYLNGEWLFLKIAKPLIDFSNDLQVNKLISELDTLQSKHYNTIEINCYWHHFDEDGDGIPDKSLQPLNRLIDTIYSRGMFPCLSVETYSVGGGQIPVGFWEQHPNAYAIDNYGNKVKDTEYGFETNVISIFYPMYRSIVREFIKNIATGIDTKKILYFETTVEPQYMGTRNLCYSEYARSAYNAWRKENNIEDSTSRMPTNFPIPANFIENDTWNIFRAQSLAQWINGDAAAYRKIAGEDAYIAVDYLDAIDEQQTNRVGDPVVFLSYLTAPNIIQVNWSWYFPDNIPNQKAYNRVKEVKNKLKKDWAISEHMTFNGSDFNEYDKNTLELILLNTLTNGTRFGWEFVNVANNSNDNFSLYNSDWSPKKVIEIVDDQWAGWLTQIEHIEEVSNKDIRRE